MLLVCSATTCSLGCAQANKNTLVKGGVGTGGVSAAAAFKAWWQPSLWLALSGGFDFRTRQPKLGLTFGTENYGNIRQATAFWLAVLCCQLLAPHLGHHQETSQL